MPERKIPPGINLRVIGCTVAGLLFVSRSSQIISLTETKAKLETQSLHTILEIKSILKHLRHNSPP